MPTKNELWEFITTLAEDLDEKIMIKKSQRKEFLITEYARLNAVVKTPVKTPVKAPVQTPVKTVKTPVKTPVENPVEEVTPVQLEAMPQNFAMYDKIKTSNQQHTVQTIDQIYNLVQNNDTPVGYEGLYGRVKPYFDFDFKYTSEAEQNANEYSDIKTVTDDVKAFLSVPVEYIKVLTANGFKRGGGYVNFIHIIVHTHDDYESGKHLLDEIKAFPNWTKGKEPDFSVYKANGMRQLFRLPYCTKEGEDRPFVITHIGPCPTRKAIDTQTEDLSKAITHTSKQELTVDMLEQCMISVYFQLTDMTPKVQQQKKASQTTHRVNRSNSIRTDSYWELFESAAPTIAQAFVCLKETSFGERTIINTTRLTPSDCNICESTHTNDNTLYLSCYPKQNKIFRGCIRKPEVHMFACKIDEDRNENTEDENLDLDPDNNLANDEQVATEQEKPTKKSIIQRAYEGLRTKRLDLPFKQNGKTNRAIAKIKTFENRFVLDNVEVIEDETPVIALRSPMDTGKTFAMREKVKLLLETNPKAYIIVNSFRVSLADKYKKDYETLDFFAYNEDRSKKIDNTVKRLIIQLDSYARINWKKVKPDLFIIDEISQVRQHITNSTFLNQKRNTRNWLNFKWCVVHAKQVVIMDANLTTNDIDFINNIRNNGRKSPAGAVQDCQIYQNNYRTPTEDAKTVYITDNKYSIIRQVIKVLKQGLRCYIADNGNVENIIALGKMLTKGKCKTLVICQQTLHHQKVKDALKNPNEEFGKYNLVICSPSVQSGVSYDQFKDLATRELTVPFDRVFGMFGNNTNMSSDAVQMLRRIRQPTGNAIYVSITQQSTKTFSDLARLSEEMYIKQTHLLDLQCQQRRKMLTDL
jgi:hypothetical protein